jgi:hypothetical protein
MPSSIKVERHGNTMTDATPSVDANQFVPDEGTGQGASFCPKYRQSQEGDGWSGGVLRACGLSIESFASITLLQVRARNSAID